MSDKLLKVAQLLGPKFIQFACQTIAELSYDTDFWDDQAPEPGIYMQSLLSVYVQNNKTPD